MQFVAQQGSGYLIGRGQVAPYEPVQVHPLPVAAEAHQHTPVKAGNLSGLRKSLLQAAKPQRFVVEALTSGFSTR
jgi:hypothetical protein